MAYKVFLSHNSVDVGWVKWIADNAKGVGVEAYLYEHDPQPGTYITEKVKMAIRDSDALVVLLTHNSQYSPYVHQEIGYGEKSGKLIIPLVQPGIPKGSLAMLEGREYISFDFQKPERGLGTLLDYLQRLKQGKENANLALLALGGLVLVALLKRRGEEEED